MKDHHNNFGECGKGCVDHKRIHNHFKTIDKAREVTAHPEKTIPNVRFAIAAQEARRREADMAFLIDLLTARRDELKAVGDEIEADETEEILAMLGADIHDPAREIAAKIVQQMGALLARDRRGQMEMAGKMADEQLIAFGGSLKILNIHWALRKAKGNQTEAAKLAEVTQGRISQVFNEKIAPFYKRHGIMADEIYCPPDPTPSKKMPGWSKHDATENVSDPAASLPSDYEQNEPLY